MSAQSRSASDQVAAHVRDLTPAQLVEFVKAMAVHIERHATILAANGRPDLAGPIGLSSSLAGLAAATLAEKLELPSECVASTLESINALVYGAKR